MSRAVAQRVKEVITAVKNVKGVEAKLTVVAGIWSVRLGREGQTAGAGAGAGGSGRDPETAITISHLAFDSFPLSFWDISEPTDLLLKKNGAWHVKCQTRNDKCIIPVLLFCFHLVLLIFAYAVQVQGIPKGTSQKPIQAEEKLEAEQRLADLGYWTGPVDGNLDPAFRHALIAFQKVEGRERTGRLTPNELNALRVSTRPLPRFTHSPHLEIDIRRQVLFIVDADGLITHILPVCTGNEKSYVDHRQVHRAHTPRGTFRILRKISGWRLSSLGLLYYPNYIHEGVAIHGSPVVFSYPASHGCIRVPMFAAKKLGELTPIGTEVIIYDSFPR